MEEYNFGLDTPFEKILETQYWTANSRGIQTERYQAIITAKLAKIVESAEKTADTFNKRILGLTYIATILAFIQTLALAPTVWGWVKAVSQFLIIKR